MKPKSRAKKLYPYLYPTVPQHAIRLFEWLRSNITLVSGGMGGVTFRHNTRELKELMDLEDGLDFRVLRPFVEEFEALLMQQYIKNSKES